jgi:hypothetical protein
MIMNCGVGKGDGNESLLPKNAGRGESEKVCVCLPLINPEVGGSGPSRGKRGGVCVVYSTKMFFFSSPFRTPL